MKLLIRSILLCTFLYLFLTSCTDNRCYCEVICTSTEGGTIYYHPNNDLNSLHLKGVEVMVEACPEENYKFVGWYITGTDVLLCKELIYTFTVLYDTCLEARFMNVYSNKYPVTFSCDISKSPFNKVQTSGYFLSVRPTPTKEGYKVREPDGREQTIPYTEVHSRVFSFGLAGLIIGKPYFGDDMIYAYDLGCPQCDRASSRLNIKDDCTAVCPKCGNSYDLNNGGVAKTGDSSPLYRYRTTLNGNMLMIHN